MAGNTLENRGSGRGESGFSEFLINFDVLRAIEGPGAEILSVSSGNGSGTIDNEFDPRAFEAQW